MDVTNRIRHILDAKQMSQAALARNLGVSQPFLSQVLNGRKKLSLELLLLICRTLEVSPAEILQTPIPQLSSHPLSSDCSASTANSHLRTWTC